MIHRDGGEMQMECDGEGCKTTTETYVFFKEMLADAKADGWLIFKRRGVFKHFCSWICSE